MNFMARVAVLFGVLLCVRWLAQNRRVGRPFIRERVCHLSVGSRAAVLCEWDSFYDIIETEPGIRDCRIKCLHFKFGLTTSP